jgi:DNA-binding NarL/FixJ family response regulator
MNYEILVVDDNGKFASSVAKYISLKTKLECFATDNPEKAIEVAQENSIKVALLDQRMPEMSGTTLFAKLRSFDRCLRGVMLTGEATSEEVGTALGLGFSAYVNKGDVKRIPEIVMTLYLDHEIDLARSESRHTEVVYTSTRRLSLLSAQQKIFLTNLLCLDNSFVDQNEWTPILQLSPGEERKVTENWLTTEKLTHESRSESSFKASAGISGVPVADLVARIERTVTSAFRDVVELQSSHSKTIERTFRLQNNEGDSTRGYVRARNMECAPVYVRLLATFEATCDGCVNRTVFPVVLRFWTGLYRTRQIDSCGDGTVDTIDTGLVRFP